MPCRPPMQQYIFSNCLVLLGSASFSAPLLLVSPAAETEGKRTQGCRYLCREQGSQQQFPNILPTTSDEFSSKSSFFISLALQSSALAISEIFEATPDNPSRHSLELVLATHVPYR